MKNLIRWCIFSVIVLLAGFQGIVFFFADYGPGENEYTRLVMAFIYYFICGLVLSWLSYPHTRFAAAVIWGVTAVALLNFPQTFKEGIHSFAQTFLMVNVPFLAVLVAEKVMLMGKSKKSKKAKSNK